MGQENRGTQEPIPEDLDNYLNDLQRDILNRIGKFGWSIAFVRRENPDKPLLAVTNSDGDKIGVMETDGNINFDPDIDFRKEACKS